MTTGSAFLEQMISAFERAWRFGPTRMVQLELAGREISLRLAGRQALAIAAPMIDTLARRGEGATDYSLSVWDTTSTGVPAPRSSWGLDQFDTRGNLVDANSGGVRVVHSPQSELLEVVFGRSAYVCYRRPKLAPWDQAAPWRTIFSAWLQAMGGALLHAAGVASNDDGLLLIGPSGTGKSTTALSAGLHGMHLLGDDLTGVVRVRRELRALRLYPNSRLPVSALPLCGLDPLVARSGSPLEQGSARVTPDEDPSERIPGQNDSDGKVQVSLECTAARDSARIRALVVPEHGRVSDGPNLVPISRCQALLAIAPPTTAAVPGVGHTALPFLLQLVSEIPAFALRLSPSPSRNAGLLRELLTTLSQRGLSSKSRKDAPCSV